MTVWQVLEDGAPVYFVCGPCATGFFRASATRTEPAEVTPPDAVEIRPCTEEVKF